MKKLYRCRWNRKLFGVFGGLGQILKIDPNVLRLIAIFLTIPLGFVVVPIIYLIAAYLIPEGPICFMQPSYKKLYKIEHGKLIFGICNGLSRYINIDVNILRLLMIVGCIVTGFFPIAIAYIAANILIPFKPHHTLS